jgi:hypothetical protein
MQQLDKPTVKQIEEYMASLNLPEQGFNGTTKEDLYNTVSKPKHYMLFEDKGIEVRDVIEKLVGKLELTSMGHSYMFAADYVQLMQYLMRFMDKNGKEDLEKARWYLDKMIEAY